MVLKKPNPAVGRVPTPIAKQFFESLYAKSVAGVVGDFDAIVTRLVARQGDAVVAGDQALQGLMINYVLTNPKAGARAQGISASVAGIKMRSVTDFVRTFPTANLTELIAAAEKAGYDVEVLGPQSNK